MSYKGLCVGGVRAGEWVSKDISSFVAQSPTQPSDEGPQSGAFEATHQPTEDGEWLVRIYPMRQDETDCESIRTTYVHVVAEDVCEFWVPKGKTAEWALQELVRCYRREHLPPVAEPPQA